MDDWKSYQTQNTQTEIIILATGTKEHYENRIPICLREEKMRWYLGGLLKEELSVFRT